MKVTASTALDVPAKVLVAVDDLNLAVDDVHTAVRNFVGGLQRRRALGDDLAQDLLRLLVLALFGVLADLADEVRVVLVDQVAEVFLVGARQISNFRIRRKGHTLP